MDPVLRPMSTSQVLDRTFHLYRNNFVLFAGIAMVAPALTLVAGLAQLWVFGTPGAPKFDPAGDPAALYPFLTSFLLQAAVQWVTGMIAYAIGSSLATGATMYAVSMVHLGKKTTIAESYRNIRPVFWKILGIVLATLLIALGPLVVLESGAIAILILQLRVTVGGGGPPSGSAVLFLLLALALLGGMLVSVVWMVYSFCRYSLAVPASILEKLPPGRSLRRSSFLIKNGVGRILGVFALTLLMSFVLTTILQLPGYIGGNAFNLKPGMHMSAFTVAWLFVGEFLGKTLAGPIVTIAIALLYYDQRIRKEAFDLQLMMEAVAQQSPQAAAAAAPPMIG